MRRENQIRSDQRWGSGMGDRAHTTNGARRNLTFPLPCSSSAPRRPPASRRGGGRRIAGGGPARPDPGRSSTLPGRTFWWLSALFSLCLSLSPWGGAR